MSAYAIVIDGGSAPGKFKLALPLSCRILPIMETFGQKVRLALASQGLPLERVAEATGLGIEQIRALECDDFGALPDDDIVREGLRSFALLVEVDPDEVVADFFRGREIWLATMPAESGVGSPQTLGDEPVRIEPTHRPAGPFEAEPPRKKSRRTRGIAILASAIFALVVLAFLFRNRTPARPEAMQPARPRNDATIVEAPRQTPEPPDAPIDLTVPPTDRNSRPPESDAAESTLEPGTDASELSVRESGVGRDVVDHRLVGEAEQFAEGERVWFWTRIEGGIAGESVEHVWLHEGTTVLRVPMKLGGGSWRTRSYKYLNPGSAGSWAVEARDEAGRVLARREFHCTPRS